MSETHDHAIPGRSPQAAARHRRAGSCSPDSGGLAGSLPGLSEPPDLYTLTPKSTFPQEPAPGRLATPGRAGDGRRGARHGSDRAPAGTDPHRVLCQTSPGPSGRRWMIQDASGRELRELRLDHLRRPGDLRPARRLRPQGRAARVPGRICRRRRRAAGTGPDQRQAGAHAGAADRRPVRPSNPWSTPTSRGFPRRDPGLRRGIGRCAEGYRRMDPAHRSAGTGAAPDPQFRDRWTFDEPRIPPPYPSAAADRRARRGALSDRTARAGATSTRPAAPRCPASATAIRP